jgi:hypothetical protein
MVLSGVLEKVAPDDLVSLLAKDVLEVGIQFDAVKVSFVGPVASAVSLGKVVQDVAFAGAGL